MTLAAAMPSRLSDARIVSARVEDVVMRPAPIRPAWIIAGEPVARIAEHSRSADGASSTFVWDCTAGTFHWYFGGDETVHILEGEVRVDDGTGERVLTAGSVALFRAGTWARWHVPLYVRKVAFCHDALPRPLSLGFRALRKARRVAYKVLLAIFDDVPDGPLPPAAAPVARAGSPRLRRLLLLGLRSVAFGLGLAV